MIQADTILMPLLKRHDDAVRRLNKDQNSYSLTVKKRAARALVNANDRLVGVLSERAWPEQISADVKRLINRLNRMYPVLSTMSTAANAEIFRDETIRNLLPLGLEVAAAMRTIDVKLRAAWQ